MSGGAREFAIAAACGLVTLAGYLMTGFNPYTYLWHLVIR